MRMCWSKRYSGSEMIGVSFKRQRMVISFRATVIDQPLEMLPGSFTSIWLRNRTFMDPSECSMFSPSSVLTVSVDIQQRNRQFDRFLGSRFQRDPLSHAEKKTYSPSSWNGTPQRTWSWILSAVWPRSSWSVSHLQAHCLDLKRRMRFWVRSLTVEPNKTRTI